MKKWITQIPTLLKYKSGTHLVVGRDAEHLDGVEHGGLAVLASPDQRLREAGGVVSLEVGGVALADPRAEVELAHLRRGLKAVVPGVELVVDPPVEGHPGSVEGGLLPHDLDYLLAVTLNRRGEGGYCRRGGIPRRLGASRRAILAPNGPGAQSRCCRSYHDTNHQELSTELALLSSGVKNSQEMLQNL